MGLVQTINYDNGANFTYDPALIQFTGGKAKLKAVANQGQTFNQGFASSAGFTFDAAKAEFAAGVVRSKDQRPAGATFYASFASSLNASWSSGSGTATNSGATLNAGHAEMLGGAATKYVEWAAAGNADALQTGCIRFRVRPAYSGTPATNQQFLNIFQTPSSNNNRIGVFHNGAQVSVWIFSSTGAGIMQVNLGAWSPTAGTTYEFELNYDLTAGATRLFIDGVQFGATQTATGTRTAVTTMRSGEATFSQAANYANFSLDALAVFSAVQHTANYTPGAALPETAYVEAPVTLPAFAYSGVGAVQAFTAFAATSSGAPRYILNGLYWTGAAWAVSDGTFAQASDAAAVHANIGVLPVSTPLTVKAVLGAGNTQVQVDDLTVTYTGEIYPTSDPAVENNSGIDADGLAGFAAVTAAAGGDAVRFQLVVAGTRRWWNGSAWADSDGSFAQSNAAAEIDANKGALGISAGVVLRVRAVLRSATGATTPDITSVTLTYDFFAPTPTPIAECIVYGHLRDVAGDAAPATTKLVVRNDEVIMHGSYAIQPGEKSVAPDATGRVEVGLVETASVGKKYTFEVETVRSDSRAVRTLIGKAMVPNQASANLASLAFSLS